MPRTITAGMASAVAQSNVELVVLVSLDLPDGILRFNSSGVTIAWGGFDWIGAGGFTSLQPIEESISPQAAALALQFSGIDTSFVQQIMEDHYQGRAATIYLCAISAGAVVADPMEVFVGRIDEPTVEMGSTATITITLENRWAGWERAPELLYTDAEQQIEFPGDTGFRYVEEMENLEIAWGQFKGPAAPKINVPRSVKQFLVNPYLPVVNAVKRILGGLF